MKIKEIELFKVPPRWLFLKITTDDELVGWGEPVVEGKAETVKTAVLEMKEYLVGHDVDKIEDLWQVLYRGSFYRGGPILMSAISGIEQALWDIKGKKLGVPVYQLLGGAVRNKLKLYTWIGGDRPHNIIENAKEQIKKGYQAVKMNASADMEWIESPKKISDIIERVGKLRDAIGWDIGIALDFHGRIHKAIARILVKELEPFKLMFIEEPVLSENNEALKTIRQISTIPIATGERLYTRWGFKKLMEDGNVDIVQPDISHAGGIWETRKIAAMAEAYDIAIAPHCPLGPVAFASSLQLDFSTPNCFIQESSLGIHYNNGADLLDYLLTPKDFTVENGYLILPQKPGLGIELDEKKILKLTTEGHTWKNPVWRNFDGTVTEW